MYPDWEQAATADERNAAVYYTTEAYREINAHLRERDDKTLENASDKVKKAVDNIDKAMAKFNLTENITVFRGGSNTGLWVAHPHWRKSKR